MGGMNELINVVHHLSAPTSCLTCVEAVTAMIEKQKIDTRWCVEGEWKKCFNQSRFSWCDKRASEWVREREKRLKDFRNDCSKTQKHTQGNIMYWSVQSEMKKKKENQ